MAQPDRNSQKEKPPRGNEPSFNWRGVILIAIAFALIGLAVLFRGGAYNSFEDVPYNRFIELLENKQIVNDKNFPLQLVYQAGDRPQRRAAGAVSHHRRAEFCDRSPGEIAPGRHYARDSHRLEPDGADARRFPADRALSARSLFPVPPANPDGRKRGAEFRQI